MCDDDDEYDDAGWLALLENGFGQEEESPPPPPQVPAILDEVAQIAAEFLDASSRPPSRLFPSPPLEFRPALRRSRSIAKMAPVPSRKTGRRRLKRLRKLAKEEEEEGEDMLVLYDTPGDLYDADDDNDDDDDGCDEEIPATAAAAPVKKRPIGKVDEMSSSPEPLRRSFRLKVKDILPPEREEDAPTAAPSTANGSTFIDMASDSNEPIIFGAADLRLFPFQEEAVGHILDAWRNRKYVAKDVQTGPQGEHKDALYRLAPARCFLLFDEMGLGKTIQALSALRRLEGRTRPSLIVVPSTCLDEWTKELLRHFGGDFDYVRCESTTGKVAKMLEGLGPRHVVLTTYSVVSLCFKTYICTELNTQSQEDLLRLCEIYNVTMAPGKNAKESLQSVHAFKDMITKFKPKKMDPAVFRLFMTTVWEVVIFDEIQKAKTSTTLAAQACAFLRATYRLGLSGTPIMNSGKEMVNVLKYGLGLLDADWYAVSRAPEGPYTRALLRLVTLGRLKRDLPDDVRRQLPERNRQDERVILDWTGETAMIQTYCRVRDESMLALSDEERTKARLPDETDDAYRLRMRMQENKVWHVVRQLKDICLHPAVPYRKDPAYVMDAGWPEWTPENHGTHFTSWFRVRVKALMHCTRALPLVARMALCRAFAAGERFLIQPSPKMLAFLDIYREMERSHAERGSNKKIICTSSSRVFCEQIMGPWLTQIGINWVLYAGDTKAKQERALQQFRTDPECTVLVMVKMVGSLGLNLQCAAHMVLFDAYWNSAMDEQVSQRIDRLGQEHPVVIRKLFMRHSVDMIIGDMQQRKDTVTNAWLARNGSKLTMTEMRLYLREQDGVGRDAPRPVPEVIRKLDEVINEKRDAPKRVIDNVVSEGETTFWLTCVSIPGALCGPRGAGKETVVASRRDVCRWLTEQQPPSDAAAAFPVGNWCGASPPFWVYETMLNHSVAAKDAPFTRSHVMLQLQGDPYERWEKYRERIEAGTCRELNGHCFGGYFDGHMQKPPAVGKVWVDETQGRVYGSFTRDGYISHDNGARLYFGNTGDAIRLCPNSIIKFDGFAPGIRVVFCNLAEHSDLKLALQTLASAYAAEINQFLRYWEYGTRNNCLDIARNFAWDKWSAEALKIKHLFDEPDQDMIRVDMAVLRVSCEKIREINAGLAQSFPRWVSE